MFAPAPTPRAGRTASEAVPAKKELTSQGPIFLITAKCMQQQQRSLVFAFAPETSLAAHKHAHISPDNPRPPRKLDTNRPWGDQRFSARRHTGVTWKDLQTASPTNPQMLFHAVQDGADDPDLQPQPGTPAFCQSSSYLEGHLIPWGSH